MSKREDRVRIVLEAATELILDPGCVNLAAGLTLDKLSDATGVDASQISKDFSTPQLTGKEGLLKELIPFILDPTRGMNSDLVVDFFTKLRSTGHNKSLTLDQKIDILADFLIDIANANNQLYREMLLWGMSKDDRQLKAAFGKLYKSWIDQGRILIIDLLDELDELDNFDESGHELAISARDFIVSATALTIGLGVITNTSEALMPPSLHKRALRALIQSWITFDE